MTQQELDPLRINERLYRQVGVLLDQLEKGEGKVTMRERVQALIAVGRLQTIFADLRKGTHADERTGSSVRKYEKAFQNDPRGRKKSARSSRVGTEPEPDDWFEHAGVAGNGDDGDDDHAA